MPDTAVRIENLGKKYRISHKQPQRYIALRDILVDRAKGLGRRILRPFGGEDASSRPGTSTEDFWALKDVSFDVKQGERVGVIGRNGAGKSTLLKILSRITEPTTGRALVKGRIASLLEIGTGFHPELTGRENIFLNGAILGMSRAEIRKNFDAIVDFAGVEQFLDTPVKHYSSGMYVRLAFAVAAHLDTEILFVDEVLAVGDAEFQKKCMGKMDDISHKQGRTIFFVSHNMGAIRQLCGRVVCMDRGKVALDSEDVSEGVKKYLSDTAERQKETLWINEKNSFQNPWFQPLRFGLYDKGGCSLSGPADRRGEVWLEIEGLVEKPNSSLCVGYILLSDSKEQVYCSYFSDLINGGMDLGPLCGRVRLRTKVPVSFLNNGLYSFELQSDLYRQEWITQPHVNAPKIYMNLEGAFSSSPMWSGKREGVMAPLLPWELGV